MSIAVDNRQQQLGGFATNPQMRFYQSTPHFTNPWASTAVNASNAYAAAAAAAAGPVSAETMSQQQPAVNAAHSRSSVSAALPISYPTSTLPAISLPSGTFSTGSFSNPHPSIDSPLQGYNMAAPQSVSAYGQEFANATQMNTFGTNTGLVKPDLNVLAQQQQQQQQRQKANSFAAFSDRRVSHPSVVPNVMSAAHASSASLDFGQNNSSLNLFNSLQTESERNSFSDALDASRGMLAMSQDITPRNIYDVQGNASRNTDAYGFPSTHSSHSSFSSSSGFPGYYGGSSVSEASYGDYGSATESVGGQSIHSQSSYMSGHLPPAPHTMMSQFSSKVNSGSQKKHKCKICDKRFTRPSSLQTHMYSHTGEKPYTCEVEGCGRQFSVVSNLRRHRKVHRGGSDQYSDCDE